MICISDAAIGDGFLKKSLLSDKLLEGILLFPLEGSEGLGNEARNADGYAKSLGALRLRHSIVLINNMLCKGSNAHDILIGLGRKAVHEVKLNVALATTEGDANGTHQVLLGNILIDNVTKTLCACLGCEGNTTGSYRRNLLHQLLGEAVDTKRRKREANVSVICPFKKTVGKLGKPRIIADRERNKRNLVIAGVVIEALCLFAESFNRLFSDRSIHHACLTEAATTDASAVNLKNDSVMYGLDIRHNELLGIGCLIKILNNTLLDLGGNVIVERSVFLNSAVLVIGNVIERGNVNAINMARLAKEGGFCIAAISLHLIIKVADLKKNLLTLTNIDKVKEVSHWLGVINARAAADDDGTVICPILRPDGEAGKLQHCKSSCIAHLVLEREGNKVELGERIATLNSGKRNVIFLHLLLHISPGSVHTLAPDVFVLIKNVIEDSYTKIGHANLVCIGETEGETAKAVLLFLHNAVKFTADVSAGL